MKSQKAESEDFIKALLQRSFFSKASINYYYLKWTYCMPCPCKANQHVYFEANFAASHFTFGPLLLRCRLRAGRLRTLQLLLWDRAAHQCYHMKEGGDLHSPLTGCTAYFSSLLVENRVAGEWKKRYVYAGGRPGNMYICPAWEKQRITLHDQYTSYQNSQYFISSTDPYKQIQSSHCMEIQFQSSVYAHLRTPQLLHVCQITMEDNSRGKIEMAFTLYSQTWCINSTGLWSITKNPCSIPGQARQWEIQFLCILCYGLGM